MHSENEINSSDFFILFDCLCRRRMRCSTNIYLTALAFSDIAYLMFVFIMSLQHYTAMKQKHMYWSFYGISHWFHDALCECSSAAFFLPLSLAPNEAINLTGSSERDKRAAALIRSK